MAEPDIGVQAIHDSGPGNLPPTRVVIHTTEPNEGYPRSSAAGSALATAHYFQEPAAGGSAHYIVDIEGEEHCVADSHIAWHAPPNPHSLGIEICAQGVNTPQHAGYTRDQWLSPEVWPAVVLAAKRTADLCSRYGIPLVRLTPTDLLNGAHGICGHVDVTEAWHESTHTDPGPTFPWAEFMTAVHAATAGTPIETTKDDKMDVTPFLIPANKAGALALPVDPVGTSFVLPNGARAWFRLALYGQDITINRLGFYGAKGATIPIGKPTLMPRAGNYSWELPAETWQVEIDYAAGSDFYGIVSAIQP